MMGPRARSISICTSITPPAVAVHVIPRVHRSERKANLHKIISTVRFFGEYASERYTYSAATNGKRKCKQREKLANHPASEASTLWGASRRSSSDIYTVPYRVLFATSARVLYGNRSPPRLYRNSWRRKQFGAIFYLQCCAISARARAHAHTYSLSPQYPHTFSIWRMYYL